MMAKEQLHSWAKTLLILTGIVFAGGGYAMKVNDNTKDITKVEVKVEKNNESIHTLELNERDMQAVYSGISKSLGRIETFQGRQAESQKATEKSVAVMEKQLQHLEKVE